MRGKNPHDKLAPSMSALILISHVKKGAELARKHKLGPEITDMIRQHHGNSVISFFFHKAQAQAKPGETVREEDYRYPGPRPQTREAGLVMLADAIEASSRTLQEPTPARIKAHIDTIIKRIFSEGQLDDSALTFKDLSAVGQTFHRILTGIFHQRIDYPGPAPARNDKAGREPKGQPARVTALPTGQAQQEREPDDRPDHGPEQGRDKAAR
jgi:membrane-associated HD superfamily phosphohydrolase